MSVATVLGVIAAGVIAAAPAIAQSAPIQRHFVDYSKSERWLCLPGRKDACSTPLATTALNADGYGSSGRSTVAADPPIDCFYVYPTVSSDSGLNSDLSPGREEQLMVETQFARFASVCRPFAPVYRQLTLASIAAYITGSDVKAEGEIAYRDVESAFRNYIATRSNARPFVLIGHSQGALMLQQLIVRVIEKDPALRRRMLLAIVPGWDVLVPPGRLVGGTFARTPLCSKTGQTGCVMSWTSYREKNAPPPSAMLGYADQPGMTVGCTNPALPGTTSWMKLDSYWFANSTLAVPGGPIRWSSQGNPPSPYLHTGGLASGRCVNDGPRGYLSIRTNHAPGDKRTDRIGGEVSVFGMFLPGWGMHLSDIALAQGDLIRIVGDLGARSAKKPSPLTPRDRSR